MQEESPEGGFMGKSSYHLMTAPPCQIIQIILKETHAIESVISIADWIRMSIMSTCRGQAYKITGNRLHFKCYLERAL